MLYTIIRYNKTNKEVISKVAIVKGDIDGHIEKRMFLYIILYLALYNIILRLP